MIRLEAFLVVVLVSSDGLLKTRTNANLNNIPPLPPPGSGGKGGNDFCVISQAGGATAKLQEPGWGHIQRGEDDFRQLSRGRDCFIMTNCWYFHKTLHLEFYKFRLWRYLIFF